MTLYFPQKRPAPFDSLTVKRQRLVDQRSQQQQAENRLLSHNIHDAPSPSLNPSFTAKNECPQPNAFSGTQNDQNVFPVIHKQSSTPETHFSEGRKQETKVELQSDPDCSQLSLVSILHKKKKSKKHKDKQQDWLTDDKHDTWFEKSRLKQKAIKIDSK